MIILSCLTLLVLALFFKSLWSYSAIEQTQMTDHLNEIEQKAITTAEIITTKTSSISKPNLRLVSDSHDTN